MRKFMFVLAVMVTAIGLGLGQSQMTTCPDPNDTYVVKAGDTVWNLSEVYLRDPKKYESVMELNPHLKDRLERRNSRVIVWIYPGDKVCGLKALGIAPPSRPASTEIAESGKDPKEPTPLPQSTKAEGNLSSPWLWLLLFLIAAVIGFLFWRLIMRDPATSGVPIVQGGITPDQPNAVENRFARMAERRYAAMDPNANLSVARPVRIGPIEEGTLTGYGRVTYGDNRTEMRRLNREPAYRALFRFPNGTEEMLFFLQACANDVTYLGARYHGFTFTPGRQVAPIPQPEPLRVVAVGGQEREDRIQFTFNGIVVSMSRGMNVRMEHGVAHLTVSGPTEITLRRETAAKRPRQTQAAPATAAGGPQTSS